MIGSPSGPLTLDTARDWDLRVRFNWIIGRHLAREVAQYTSLGFLAAAPVVMIPNGLPARMSF